MLTFKVIDHVELLENINLLNNNYTYLFNLVYTFNYLYLFEFSNSGVLIKSKRTIQPYRYDVFDKLYKTNDSDHRHVTYQYFQSIV